MQIISDVEFLKVKLPDTVFTIATVGQASVLVSEGKPKLDELHQVSVSSEGLVMIIGTALENARGSKDDAREFSIDGDERVIIDERLDEVDFMMEVMSPDVTDKEASTVGDRHVQD